MNDDDVALSIRQMDGAWQLMCAGTPRYVEATREGITYIFSGLPISFFNLALLTGFDAHALHGEAVPRAALRVVLAPHCTYP